MYVCMCNGYRDAEIRELARSGIRCARTAYRTLGGEPRCGKCLTVAQDLIDRVHGNGAAATATAAVAKAG